MKLKVFFKITNVFIIKRLNLHNEDCFDFKNSFKFYLDWVFKILILLILNVTSPKIQKNKPAILVD